MGAIHPVLVEPAQLIFLDLDVDADLGEVSGDGIDHVAVFGCGRVKRRLKAIGIARLGQQRFRFLRIVGVGLYVRVEAQVARPDRAGDLSAKACQQVLNDGLHVHSIVEGLAHADVVGRC